MRIDTPPGESHRFDNAIAVAVQVVVTVVTIELEVIEREVIAEPDSEVREVIRSAGGDVEVVAVAAGVVGDTRVCRGRDEEELWRGGGLG